MKTRAPGAVRAYVIYNGTMSEDVLSPLVGTGLRIQTKAQLDDFLTLPEAREIVRSSSFEQVFFTIKTLGIADSIELLSLVTERQVRGFIDLDCWRKDSFVRKPFMEWIAAFVQAGAEETVRALRGIDEDLIALFLTDLITVYEIERDEPPPATQLVFSPDNQFAVHMDETGEAATIASLILDALFRYEPDLGYRLLGRVRYATRTELEETAYQNKVRRLDVHGFVDYYEALSIYAGPAPGETSAQPRGETRADEEISEEEEPRSLPTVFADSLAGGGFLLAALGRVPASESDRLAQELTALGNRILSANLVNLGEVEGIRSALGEMRDFLTVGLEHVSAGDPDVAPRVLGANHVQHVFKSGFDQLARLRDLAEELGRFPSFKSSLLESPDREFFEGLLRFKPLLWDDGRYRNFQNMAEVSGARRRLEDLRTMARGFLKLFGPSDATLRRRFNTAAIRKAVTGKFEPVPLTGELLEEFIRGGMVFPRLELAEELVPFAEAWLIELRAELEPLSGQKIDPRFLNAVLIQ